MTAHVSHYKTSHPHVFLVFYTHIVLWSGLSRSTSAAWFERWDDLDGITAQQTKNIHNERKQTSKPEIICRPRTWAVTSGDIESWLYWQPRVNTEPPQLHLQQRPLTRLQLSVPLITLSRSDTSNRPDGCFSTVRAEISKKAINKQQTERDQKHDKVQPWK